MADNNDVTAKIENQRRAIAVLKKTAQDLEALSVDLVLKQILSYLSKQDLLNCRLVNQRWSSAALNVIRNRGKTINLDCRNISGHLEFLAENPNSKFNLNYDVAFPDYCTDAINKLIFGVQKIVKLFGPHCVTSLTYHHYDNYGDKILALFPYVSAGLQTLRISNNHEFPSSSTHLIEQLSFPELKSFYYHGFTSKENEASARTICKIINSAPKLQTLMLLHFNLDPYQELTINEPSLARLFNLLKESGETLSKVRELQITLVNSTTFEPLAEFYLPSLRKFTVHIDKPFRYDEALRTSFATVIQFLGRNADNLMSFDCFFGYHSSATCEEFLTVLPHLPNLRHLGYHVRSQQYGGFLLPRFLQISTIDPMKFPSLFSVSTDVGALFSPSRRQGLRNQVHLNVVDYEQDEANPRRSLDVPWTKLALKIDQSTGFSSMPENESNSNVLDNIRRIRRMFPNVKQICINNQIQKLISDDNEFFQQLVQGLCEEMTRLEELEIQNYDDDWLLRTLQESPKALTALQGLKCIRIPPVEKYINNTPTGPTCPRNLKKTMRQRKTLCLEPTLGFLAILELLPNLKRFEFGQGFLSTTATNSSSSCMNSAETPLSNRLRVEKQLKYLSAKFPTVQIKLL